MKIDILIGTKDRPTELALLLQSLRTQTYKDWDVYILDDAGTTPITNYYFINYITQRLRFEGHRVIIIRNEKSKGVCASRQQIAEYAIKEGKGELLARIDDDCMLDERYFEKLIEVINQGYDLASGITPPVANPLMQREIKFVSPVINRVVLDADGKFLINCDDCGHSYIEETILPTDHFRSCAVYKKSVHEKVRYETNITPYGFREEQFFSFRMIVNGFKLGVHTGAIAWHLMTPSGGERCANSNELTLQNQILLNKLTKKLYARHGDFIEEYHKRLNIDETKGDKFGSLSKNNNLIFYDGVE